MNNQIKNRDGSQRRVSTKKTVRRRKTVKASGKNANTKRGATTTSVRYDEYGRPYRVRRVKKRKFRRRVKEVIIIVLALLLAWGVFVVVHYKPFNTTTINNVKLRGVLKEQIVFEGPDSEYIQTGKTYKFKVKDMVKDIFNTKVTEDIDTKSIKVKVTTNGVRDYVDIKNNTIKVSDSILSGSRVDVIVSYNNLNKSYSYSIKDNLSEEIGKNMIITNPNEYDAVVNKNRHLPSNYKPKDLVEANVDYAQSNLAVRPLRKEAAKALEALFADAKQAGYDFYALSGFRSYKMQVDVYKDNIAQYGSEEKANFYSAKAGESEHQLGLSMDVTTKEVNFKLTESLGSTDAGKWLEDNCYKNGFIIRFPKGKEKITGYSYEPWHVRYVGKTLAKVLHDNKLTLEEYFEEK
ncbi:M15 family metallopeptidase [Anaerofustis stercorihominis]|uniref:D-alanyl-D-alanine carboxypeptidase family protein n=1 Tax=Anaerofustis stercorihominis TaxID=214853 RepID=A0A3E3E0N7_9FIRM|nr:M15 family metallopeptidase [Anaerofustis stercorihominis]RGD75110.1 D-alanyl-D-alanine carboxypeptidase family protein [Anaerofustis stercorihominis]